MNSKLLLASFTIATAASLAGCAARESGSTFSRGETGREQTVRMATVEAVREVSIQGSQSPVGAIAGGVVGGIAGSSVGDGGKGSAIAAVLGSVAGGVAGNAIEEGVTRKKGLEITVKLDSGELRAIVQEADVIFKPGERVRLLNSGGVTRVTH
ncbi:MAG TPA: glycine zipper 2TM domain-containing protein [Burkholderiales bacterium]|nr:glycine zipper 2TM domain-containing protein [Burkholderiales bacterium]